MSPAVPDSHAYQHFYQIALEYYVSGRAALFSGCPTVTANLLHHAVEMLLKGQLSKTISLRDLWKKYSHDVPKLWADFKMQVPTEDLTEFDAMISELQRFESIRYPDKILAFGASIGIGLGRGMPVADMTLGRIEPKYLLGVGDVDAFFARVFPICGLNPKAYFSFVSPWGRHAVTEGNTESKEWLE